MTEIKAIRAKYNFPKEDYSQYKPKKYYTEPVDEVMLESQLREFNNELGRLPNYKELPKYYSILTLGYQIFILDLVGR